MCGAVALQIFMFYFENAMETENHFHFMSQFNWVLWNNQGWQEQEFDDNEIKKWDGALSVSCHPLFHGRAVFKCGWVYKGL